jgi:hypothetical protein
MKEREISRPQVEVEMVVLIDLEGEDKDNLYFLQALKQMIALAPQTIVESAPLIVIGFSKPNSFKSERNK